MFLNVALGGWCNGKGLHGLSWYFPTLHPWRPWQCHLQNHIVIKLKLIFLRYIMTFQCYVNQMNRKDILALETFGCSP